MGPRASTATLLAAHTPSKDWAVAGDVDAVDGARLGVEKVELPLPQPESQEEAEYKRDGGQDDL